jgi:SAM-dependent methyltransferase
MSKPEDGPDQENQIRDRYRPDAFDAERYSALNLSFWVPLMIRLGRLRRGNRVLDLGCATGGFTDAIVEATGASLVGCDMSRAMLDFARSHRRGSPARWVRADVARLPFSNRSFDRAIASLVLHQVPDRERALREIARLLEPEGVLLVRTVTPEAAARWIPERFFPSVAQAQEQRMPPIDELVELMASVGFGGIATETVVHHKELALDDTERAFRRDLVDRYPFVDIDEQDDGFARMRAHWARQPHGCVDAREVTFLIASKS